ncbi:MAG TPA: invasion associated locus B family protein [Mesorhizobium sp.]|jgi:invasion protein IalB|uniref:invasion associated locus B family protein n=1 Tax=Mesorhizobium sp. TaxID=1871066 RepID=UPI002DDCC365|nr:invasion associated locus B family protein [Mesorhizobium sp.]HEV2501722.1 invasion associated locus B family protein [Mesorhizobium sp.]
MASKRSLRKTVQIVARAVSLAPLLAMVAPVPAAPLPGGAGSLVETYQDWVVACQGRDGQSFCVMRQVQSNNQTGQNVVTVEFSAAQGKLNGLLLLPFGLALADGASVKIDGDAKNRALPFSTCLPQGCLAPVSFEADDVTKLKGAAALNVAARSFSPPQPIDLKISLKGFSTALNRITELTR